jgi:cephalosporin hydroxylase
MHQIEHPRITFLLGSSVSPEILEKVKSCVGHSDGLIMIVLDSDHHEGHVLAELMSYSPFVTVGSHCLVQDGAMDTLPVLKPSWAGPLPAIERFLRFKLTFYLEAATVQSLAEASGFVRRAWRRLDPCDKNKLPGRC